MFDVLSLLATDCGVFGVNIEAPNIPLISVECGMFSGRLLSTGEKVKYCYEKIVY